MALVLVKCCNAVAEHHSSARRVGLSAPMAALRLLQRTKAIRGEACLAMDADRSTVPINTALTEYLGHQAALVQQQPAVALARQFGVVGDQHQGHIDLPA